MEVVIGDQSKRIPWFRKQNRKTFVKKLEGNVIGLEIINEYLKGTQNVPLIALSKLLLLLLTYTVKK